MKNKDGVADLHLIEVDVLDLGASLAGQSVAYVSPAGPGLRTRSRLQAVAEQRLRIA